MGIMVRETGCETKRGGGMERGNLLVVLWFALSIGAGLTWGEEFKVGDDQGWHEPDAAHADIYALWAGRTDFRRGDSLFFEYTNDSVLVVDKRGYYHCNTTNSTAAFHDGKTVFHLRAAGLLYFISGAPGHCTNGQRLIVDVSPAAAPLQPPSLSPIAVAPSLEGPTRAPQRNAANLPAKVNALVLFVALVFL